MIPDARRARARRSRRPAPTAGCSSTFTASIRSRGGCSACRGRAQHPPAVRAAAARRRAGGGGAPHRARSRWRAFPDGSSRTPAGRSCTRRSARWWRAARSRWRSRRRTRCRISTGCPIGVVELLRRLGATVVPSGALVTRFAAGWTAEEIDGSPGGGRDPRAGGARRSWRARSGRRDSGLTEIGAAGAGGGGGGGARSGLRHAADRRLRRQLGQPALRAARRASDAALRRGPGGAARPVGGPPADDRVRRPDLDGFRGAAAARAGARGLGRGAPGARRGRQRGALRGGGRPRRSRGTRPTARRAGWWRPRATARRSSTAPATRSTGTSTARGRTWTTTRPTTTGC